MRWWNRFTLYGFRAWLNFKQTFRFYISEKWNFFLFQKICLYQFTFYSLTFWYHARYKRFFQKVEVLFLCSDPILRSIAAQIFRQILHLWTCLSLIAYQLLIQDFPDGKRGMGAKLLCNNFLCMERKEIDVHCPIPPLLTQVNIYVEDQKEVSGKTFLDVTRISRLTFLLCNTNCKTISAKSVCVCTRFGQVALNISCLAFGIKLRIKLMRGASLLSWVEKWRNCQTFFISFQCLLRKYFLMASLFCSRLTQAYRDAN